MSTSYQAYKARGTTSGCREGRCRHSLTMDKDLFRQLRESAMANHRGVSEEIAVRLKASLNRDVPLTVEMIFEMVS